MDGRLQKIESESSKEVVYTQYDKDEEIRKINIRLCAVKHREH